MHRLDEPLEHCGASLWHKLVFECGEGLVTLRISEFGRNHHLDTDDEGGGTQDCSTAGHTTARRIQRRESGGFRTHTVIFDKLSGMIPTLSLTLIPNHGRQGTLTLGILNLRRRDVALLVPNTAQCHLEHLGCSCESAVLE